MLKELKKHRLAYLVLVVGLGLGVVLFLGSWPDRSLQRLIAVGIAIFYFIWGLLAHLKNGRVAKRIIFEYLSIATLAGLLLILITF